MVIIIIKGSFLFFAFIFLIIYSSSCSSPQQSYKDKLPDGLKVVSVYGEKDFDKSNMRVDLQGWRADAPQSLFLAEPEKNKTYLMAYVLPPELVRKVWGDSATSLSHFVGLDYANIDERTTALWLVMNAPGYFWLFTPRALVYAAKFVVEHPKFEELVKKISETNQVRFYQAITRRFLDLQRRLRKMSEKKFSQLMKRKKQQDFDPVPKDGKHPL
jgi:hypothetical protein